MKGLMKGFRAPGPQGREKMPLVRRQHGDDTRSDTTSAALSVLSLPPPPPLDLATLYRAHAGTVARWAAHLGGPSVDVDDLVHEIFLVARRRLVEFRGDAKVTTWLYRITERVVRDGRRKERVRQWLGRVRRADVEQALSPTPLTPVEELDRRESRETVYRILNRLADKYRNVLILFELEGMSGEEIAALTGLKLATVWVHLHRARAGFLTEMKRQAGARR
jgi:RNA polymerase sigma-70 factor (ECF subfamily)